VIILVDGELISSIKEGLCVLVGIGRDDTKKDIDYLLVLLKIGQSCYCPALTGKFGNCAGVISKI
jgi:hypothetical protein